MKDEIREILKEYNKDIKRHIDVLKEDFDSKFALIGEQYDSIQGKLGKHENQLQVIHDKLDEHDVRFQVIEEKLEVIKNDVEVIKTSLRNKVDWDAFEALEKRVGILESKVKV